MSEPIRKKWASIYASGNFICFQSASGYRRSAIDLDVEPIFQDFQSGHSDLGATLLRALSSSRMLGINELDNFFDPYAVAKRYDAWVLDVMGKFGFADRGLFFQKVRHCSVELASGIISIVPMRNLGNEAFSAAGNPSSSRVVVSSDSSMEEIGRGVLQALTHCMAPQL